MGPARKANNYSFDKVFRKSKVSTMEYIQFSKLFSLSSEKEGVKRYSWPPPPCIRAWRSELDSILILFYLLKNNHLTISLYIHHQYNHWRGVEYEPSHYLISSSEPHSVHFLVQAQSKCSFFNFYFLNVLWSVV